MIGKCLHVLSDVSLPHYRPTINDLSINKILVNQASSRQLMVSQLLGQIVGIVMSHLKLKQIIVNNVFLGCLAGPTMEPTQ